MPPRSLRRYAACPFAGLALVACSSAAAPRDAALEPNTQAIPEAGPALPLDGALAVDASALDVSSDAAAPPGPRDGSQTEAGSPDTGAPDASPADGGELPPGFDAHVPATGASALDPGPSYLGTSGSQTACSTRYRTQGFAPADGAAKHPLFLYFVGTQGLGADQSARFDGEAPRLVTLAMAQRGFVALSVEYDNALGSFFTDKQPCLFGAQNPSSLLAVACALPAVDCSLGIATWGHSQGGLLAHAAGNYDVRVKAVWTTGYSGLQGAKLPYSRFRTVNGENDGLNAPAATANATAGMSAAEQCPEGRDRCLRSDGSGWIVVRKSACSVSSADHCWFNKRSCADSAETLEPSWADPASSTPYALSESADWVASTVRRAGP